MARKKAALTYSSTGDNYSTKDPSKILAQKYALQTSSNLLLSNYEEIAESRGESAYVWKQGKGYMASVIEGLGTKNLVADEMRKITGKTYYDVIAHDTVATIINDLVTVGARPLVIHAYWAIENNDWLADTERMNDLLKGWKSACDVAGVSWGGGETPTLKGVLSKNTIDLAGCAIGSIPSKKELIIETKLKEGDRILLLKSNGVNANGLSLVRAIAKKLPDGFATKLPKGSMFGKEVLQKTNIYANVIQDLQKSDIDIHYISNITGHGLRKIMRAKQDFTYVIENIVSVPALFSFIQEKANLTDYQMYETFNMGMDYALFLSPKQVLKAQKIIERNGFSSIDAGFIEKGEKKVVITPKQITFEGDTLGVR